MSDLKMSHEKMSDFVWFPLRKFAPVIKQRNLDLESFWNSLIFFNKKYMTSDLNMSHGKMPDFVSFSLFGFTLMMMMMNCFCGMVDRRKAFSSSLSSSRDPNLRHAASRVWTCAEPGFRLSWMKLCSSDNHYTTAPQSFSHKTEKFRFSKSLKYFNIFLSKKSQTSACPVKQCLIWVDNKFESVSLFE